MVAKIAYKVVIMSLLISLLCISIFGGFKVCEAQKHNQNQKIPAGLYIFGDSLVDVGNNNHLPSAFLKANFPYGVDYTPGKPTGRFSNGKVTSDFLAEKLKIHNAEPYLSVMVEPTTLAFLHGFNFASAGAGVIFNDTTLDGNIPSVSMTRQVNYFSDIKASLMKNRGKSYAKRHLQDSIFTIAIGSDDIYSYFQSPLLRNHVTPEKHVNLMARNFIQQLNRLYDEGARKFVVLGVGVIGCTPWERIKSQNQVCNEELNSWATIYNRDLRSILVQSKSVFKDMHYSYFDTFTVTKNFINNPSAYGFVEVNAACCGNGVLNAETACSAKTYYCTRRKDHLFWDGHHFSETAHRILVDHMYFGTSKYTYPINVMKLANI